VRRRDCYQEQPHDHACSPQIGCKEIEDRHQEDTEKRVPQPGSGIRDTKEEVNECRVIKLEWAVKNGVVTIREGAINLPGEAGMHALVMVECSAAQVPQPRNNDN